MKSNRDTVVGENSEKKLWDTLEDVMKITVCCVKTWECIRKYEL